MSDEVFQRERVGAQRYARSDLGERKIGIGSGLKPVGQNETKSERHQRCADEPGHRLQADPTHRTHIPHFCNAWYKGCEYKRRNNHLDQAEEYFSANREVPGYRGKLRGILDLIVADCPDDGAEDHRANDIARKGWGLSHGVLNGTFGEHTHPSDGFPT